MSTTHVPLRGIPCTVADLVYVEQLPEATRVIVDRVIAHKVEESLASDRYFDEEDLDNAEARGYRRGLAEGQRRAAGPQTPPDDVPVKSA